MRHRHRFSVDRAEAVPPQLLEGRGPQKSQYLNTLSLGVAVGVLTELGVARSVPLLFDGSALPHQLQPRF
jgi:hypothetical protein